MLGRRSCRATEPVNLVKPGGYVVPTGWHEGPQLLKPYPAAFHFCWLLHDVTLAVLCLDRGRRPERRCNRQCRE